jgi:hypothetical protein
LQRLDAQAAANREATKADRLAWVESEPIENIYLANLARRRIGRATGKRVHLITDHRIPKHPGNAFTLYIKARKDPSDQRDVRDRIKALAVEWHNLPPAEKRPFEDRWAADSQKYSQELEPIVQKAKERESQIKAAARNPVKNAPKV